MVSGEQQIRRRRYGGVRWESPRMNKCVPFFFSRNKCVPGVGSFLAVRCVPFVQFRSLDVDRSVGGTFRPSHWLAQATLGILASRFGVSLVDMHGNTRRSIY
jgi:hypothetical protein